MAEFIARDLDQHELALLFQAIKEADFASVVKITGRAAKDAGTAFAKEIRKAVDRLEAAGYIERRQESSKIRYYRVTPGLRDVVRVQVSLVGAADVFADRTWVMAACWHVSGGPPGGTFATVDAYLKLHEWGKHIAGADVRSHMSVLAQEGLLVVCDQKNTRFSADHGRREKLADLLRHFPLVPGYVPAPSPMDLASLADAILERAKDYGKPAKVSMYLAEFGENAVDALYVLTKDGRVGRVAAREGEWGEDDVVYLAAGGPEGTAVREPTAYIDSSLGTHPVYVLSADEVAVLKFMLKRKLGTGVYLVSKRVFGDTSQTYAPYGVDEDKTKLRARPALQSLAELGLISGDSEFWKGGYGPCRHTNRSTYRLRDYYTKRKAADSLSETTGRSHCPECGEEKAAVAIRCDACVKAAKAKEKPKPGAVPIDDPDTLKVLHAVSALAQGGSYARTKVGLIEAFAFHPDTDFTVKQARMLHAVGGSNDRQRTRKSLQFLEDNGYVIRTMGRYGLSPVQASWVEENYPPWPHVEATAKGGNAAASQAARTGRAIEFDE